MTNPSDAGTSSLYSYPSGPNPVGETLRELVSGLKNPDEATGWPRILIPALVTGIGIELVRRSVL